MNKLFNAKYLNEIFIGNFNFIVRGTVNTFYEPKISTYHEVMRKESFKGYSFFIMSWNVGIFNCVHSSLLRMFIKAVV